MILAGSLLLVLVACAAPAASPPASAPPAAPSAGASASPDEPVVGGGGPLDPGPGGPALVEPQPGLAQIHDVSVDAITAAVNGRNVAVRLEWTSGVEPCYVLAGVDTVRDGNAFTLTVKEGSADLAAACIEIAMSKATIVDLGELEPGTYTIAATGTAPPINVTVS